MNPSTTPVPPNVQASPNADRDTPKWSARRIAVQPNAHAGGHVSA
jgi:hypothetical protein